MLRETKLHHSYSSLIIKPDFDTSFLPGRALSAQTSERVSILLEVLLLGKVKKYINAPMHSHVDFGTVNFFV